MTAMCRNKRLLVLLFVLVIFTAASQGGVALGAEAPGKTVSRRIMTFYYPWYGTPDGPGGAGRTVHWRRIDAANKDIEASTNYPIFGAYDSHDPELIDLHCRWARYANIDTFIASWWGHNSFSDRAMHKILEGCRRNRLSACIYYETVPRPQTPQAAADDIVKALNKYGGHSAYLKVNGKPVVFIYGRAVGQLGLEGWLKAIELVNKEYKDGFTAIGDKFGYGSARVFDGVHKYNTAGSLRGMRPDEVLKWAAGTYRSWVEIAEKAGKISCITVIPGYDDTKIRKPGLAVSRYKGKIYCTQWEQAIKADPQWVLITSFNEWHEGSEIEPSLEYGRKYLDLTAEYAKKFKDKQRSALRRIVPGALSTGEKARLREKFNGRRIGVLPGADSMAFWWLIDVGVDTEVLAWRDVVSGDLTAKNYPVLLYCAGERYHNSVHKTGDVDDALVNYLKKGGCLLVLPAQPWPFYYDQNNQAVNGSSRFGLTLRIGWERPPRGLKLHFIQPQRYLPHVAEQFAFPTSGDLRWRPFFAGEVAKHISLLQLRDGDKDYLGDAAAYTELNSGGRILYVWFSLLEGPYAEALLYDVFDFVATRLVR